MPAPHRSTALRTAPPAGQCRAVAAPLWLSLNTTFPACPACLQEAFEKCESINQQADEWLEETAAKHGETKQRLAEARQAMAQSMERAAAAAAQ